MDNKRRIKMTFEEMKDMLINYKNMTKTVYRLQEEIKFIKESVNSIREAKAYNPSGLPSGNRFKDETYEKAVKITEEYEKRLNKLFENVEEIYSAQKKITSLMDMLTEEERKVIEARYILGLKWDIIPMRTYMSRATCFRHHDAAITKMIQWADGI